MSSPHLPATTDSLDQAAGAETPFEAISILNMILDDPSSSSEAIQIKEQAIVELSDLLRREGRADELAQLHTKLWTFFTLIPDVKTGKIVHSIVKSLAKISDTSALQISLCKEIQQWTLSENRNYLRRRIEVRIAALLVDNHGYQEAQDLLLGLIEEAKRLDDKLLRAEISLLGSKYFFFRGDLPRSKNALKLAKKSVQTIELPKEQQGSINFQSGILCAEEKDYTTAYSYFFEAFKVFDGIKDPQAIRSLEYMLLCKIMVNRADDVPRIMSWATAKGYQGLHFNLVESVAYACSRRSLGLIVTALSNNQQGADPIVQKHLVFLYDTLLELNLCRLIGPFSRVEITHIAELINLPADYVGQKLSRMILDKKLVGKIDQGADCLIIFDDPKIDTIYSAILETFSVMGKIVDRLCATSAKMMS